MFFSLLASCAKSDPDPVINPFSNGTDQRNLIVIVSDMHLGADSAYAECNKNVGPLAKLLQQIRVSANVKELVIAGDLIDEWFVPATTDTYNGKDQSDFVNRVAVTNKAVFDVLNQIIQDGIIKVIYVPGNHDLTITAENISLILPGISQARDNKLGLGTYSPADFPQIAIEHGHRYNFFCAPDPFSNQDIAPGTIMPPGYFFTRMAALHVKQKCEKSGDDLPVVTPNASGDENQQLAYKYWQNWAWSINMLPVTNMFNEKIFVTNVNGFTKTYSIDDLLPFQTTPGGFIDMKLFEDIEKQWEDRQNYNNVAIPNKTDRSIDSVATSSETDYQAQVQYFLNSASDKRIVVFGHTHDPKIISSLNYNNQKSIYANSGTWIDSNPLKTTMNFVVITPQNADVTSQTSVSLYNFMNEQITNMATDCLRY